MTFDDFVSRQFILRHMTAMQLITLHAKEASAGRLFCGFEIHAKFHTPKNGTIPTDTLNRVRKEIRPLLADISIDYDVDGLHQADKVVRTAGLQFIDLVPVKGSLKQRLLGADQAEDHGQSAAEQKSLFGG